MLKFNNNFARMLKTLITPGTVFLYKNNYHFYQLEVTLHSVMNVLGKYLVHVQKLLQELEILQSSLLKVLPAYPFFYNFLHLLC